jgi:hypothetical protein
MHMHSFYRRFGVLASLAILLVGAFSHSETSSKEANVLYRADREIMSMELTNTIVLIDANNAALHNKIAVFEDELSKLKDLVAVNDARRAQLKEDDKRVRPPSPARSSHGPLSTSEPTREITKLALFVSIIIE